MKIGSVMVFGAFQGSIETSMEDNCLFGRVLGIKDVVTYESKTPQGLEEAFRHAVINYISSEMSRGNRPALIQALDLALVLSKELNDQIDLMGKYLEEKYPDRGLTGI